MRRVACLVALLGLPAVNPNRLAENAINKGGTLGLGVSTRLEGAREEILGKGTEDPDGGKQQGRPIGGT